MFKVKRTLLIFRGTKIRYRINALHIISPTSCSEGAVLFTPWPIDIVDITMCLVSYKRKIDDISIRHYNSIGLNKILQWCNHIVEGNIRKPNIASTNSDSVNITKLCRIPSESFVQPHELSPTSSGQDLFMGTKAE